MERKAPEAKFTIGFCYVPQAEKVLVVYRNKSPNRNKWNGLGGKIDFSINETHRDCVIRELKEETDNLIDISKADVLKYVGLVTWDVARGEEKYSGGMHAYIAEFSDVSIIFDPKDTREGRLEWQDVSFLINKDNEEVVENIPFFLPEMLLRQEAVKYHCTYENDELINFEVLPLE